MLMLEQKMYVCKITAFHKASAVVLVILMRNLEYSLTIGYVLRSLCQTFSRYYPSLLLHNLHLASEDRFLNIENLSNHQALFVTMLCDPYALNFRELATLLAERGSLAMGGLRSASIPLPSNSMTVLAQSENFIITTSCITYFLVFHTDACAHRL